MKSDEFDEIVKERTEKIVEVLSIKAKEYSRGEDRLHNFKKAARMSGVSEEHCLKMFKLKHDVSVDDMLLDVMNEEYPTEEYIDEKIGDSINYLILLEALLKEKIRDAKNAFI